MNVYLRQNNNNPRANPPFGPPLCRGRKVRSGDGRKGRGRQNFKKGKGKKGRGRFVGAKYAFIYVRVRAYVFTCSVSFFRVFRSRIVRFVDDADKPGGEGKKNDVNAVKGYGRMDNGGD